MLCRGLLKKYSEALESDGFRPDKYENGITLTGMNKTNPLYGSARSFYNPGDTRRPPVYAVLAEVQKSEEVWRHGKKICLSVGDVVACYYTVGRYFEGFFSENGPLDWDAERIAGLLPF